MITSTISITQIIFKTIALMFIVRNLWEFDKGDKNENKTLWHGISALIWLILLK